MQCYRHGDRVGGSQPDVVPWVSGLPEIVHSMTADPAEFENPASDASFGEHTQKKWKRGLGKGGAAANYCTMSVASRMAQCPEEPFEEQLGSFNQSIMWCLGRGKPVSHQTKTCVKQHVNSYTHKKGKETLKKQKAKREAAATKEKEVPQLRGPNNGVEHTEVASAMIAALATVSIHPDQVQFCIMDEGSVMVAAGDHILKKVWKNSMWFLCWALHGVGSVTKASETLNDSPGILLVEMPVHAMTKAAVSLPLQVFKKSLEPPWCAFIQLLARKNDRIFCRIFFAYFRIF